MTLDSIEKVRAWAEARRADQIAFRKECRERGDSLEAYAATNVAIELGDLLALLPKGTDQ